MAFNPKHYSPSRYQTLCRLGVEQLPSLAAEYGHDDVGTSSKGKRAYYGSVSPLGGDLPLRLMPVSRSISWTHKPRFPN
jgi:hypothetical protein